MEVLRAFGCSDVVKVSCRTKSAVTLFATPAAAKKAVSKIRDASGTVEGYDMSTWKAFLASEGSGDSGVQVICAVIPTKAAVRRFFCSQKITRARRATAKNGFGTTNTRRTR